MRSDTARYQAVVRIQSDTALQTVVTLQVEGVALAAPLTWEGAVALPVGETAVIAVFRLPEPGAYAWSLRIRDARTPAIYYEDGDELTIDPPRVPNVEAGVGVEVPSAAGAPPVGLLAGLAAIAITAVAIAAKKL